MKMADVRKKAKKTWAEGAANEEAGVDSRDSDG